ncbi:alanine racemase [Amycolatopsis sp. NPDC052450]|uniref:alanine racemase n=1 Tax=Amycolatopsis sp. NPDC052450 TaxID=3363937 RepID=UPI0037C95511
MTSPPPRSAVDVDLGAITSNLAAAKELVSGADVMAVVKCDAYGHGAAEVSQALDSAGVACFGVAFLEEALPLRAVVPETPILVFTEPAPGEEVAAIEAGLTPTIASSDGVARLAAAARSTPLDVHLKIDTGLHRLGVAPEYAVEMALRAESSGLRVTGVWTHFATADDPGDPQLGVQRELFAATVERLRAAGVEPRQVHAANSSAALGDAGTHFTMVRLGAVLYGLRPGSSVPGLAGFRPAMSWRSSVVATQRVGEGERVGYGLRYRLETDSTLAVVPVGFGDGLPRLAGNRGRVIVHGDRRPIAGAVGMSHVIVDCGDTTVRVGDEVILLGRDGDTEITAEEIAQWSGTSVYEAVTRIAPGLSRRYSPAVALLDSSR